MPNIFRLSVNLYTGIPKRRVISQKQDYWTDSSSSIFVIILILNLFPYYMHNFYYKYVSTASSLYNLQLVTVSALSIFDTEDIL